MYLQGLSEGRETLLARLGKHEADEGGLHIKPLGDVDARVLDKRVANSVAHVKSKHGSIGGT